MFLMKKNVICIRYLMVKLDKIRQKNIVSIQQHPPMFQGLKSQRK